MLALLLRHHSNAEIADALHVSLPTVKNHISAVFKKLAVRSRKELFARNPVSSAANLSLPEEVVVREVPALLQPSEPIYAGFTLNPIGWPPEYNCTSGFTVRHIPTWDEGVTTAGHCKDNMAFRGTDLNYRGHKAYEFEGPYDLQWHGTPGYEDRAWIRDFSTDATYHYRYVTGARGRLDQPEGDTVCHFGTGGAEPELKCGTIVNRNYLPTHPDYNNPTSTFVKVHSSGDLDDLGDSGGPWFDGTIALGIHSGGNHNKDGNSDGMAFYMSITYFNDDGPGDFDLFVQKVD